MSDFFDINEILKKSLLFKGIESENYRSILFCLHHYLKDYQKKSTILGFDDKVEKLGIIISGSVDLLLNLPSGDSYLIDRLNPSDIIAESFAASNSSLGSFEYRSFTDCSILFLDVPRACTKKCNCNNKYKYFVMENLVTLLAKENLFLNQKLLILSQKKLRDKILLYFSLIGDKDIKDSSLNKSELASYLCSDRSSLSRELNKMKSEGLLNV